MPRKSFILSGLGGTIRDFVTTGLEIPQPDPVVGVSGPMVGDLQGVAVLSEALTTADVQSLMASAVWTDVSEDLDAAEPLIVDRGIHEDDPTVRVAATGVCTFAMDNSHRNSAETQSWYSPGHEDARPGFDRGAMVRVSMLTEDGTMIPQFYGKIRTIDVEAGIYRGRTTTVMATDWLDEAARAPTEGIETQENVRADQLVERLVDSMRHRPHGLSLDLGTDVYPFAFDSVERSGTVDVELRHIADSERGLIYVSGDGTLVLESRYVRPINTLADYTLTNILDAAQTRSTEDIVNRVIVTVNPRRRDPVDTTVLYSSDSKPRLETGRETTLFLQFRDPLQEASSVGALDVQGEVSGGLLRPVATTDFVINSQSDGAGTDLTNHPGIAIEMIVEGAGVRLKVNNQSGYLAYFTHLQIRGRGLYQYDPMKLLAENPDSIDEIGVQPVTIDMKYQDSVGVGQGTADLILNTLQSTPTLVGEVPFFLFQSPAHQLLGAHGDISTRVTYQELMAGIDADYFINGKRIEWREGGDVDVTVWLTPADSMTYAVFDVSNFDDPGTRFAY
jgi:hypothetical protein